MQKCMLLIKIGKYFINLIADAIINLLNNINYNINLIFQQYNMINNIHKIVT